MKRITKSDCDVFRMHRNEAELSRMFEAMPGDVVLSPKPKPKKSLDEL